MSVLTPASESAVELVGQVIERTAAVVEALITGAVLPDEPREPAGAWPTGQMIGVYGRPGLSGLPWPERLARSLERSWRDLAAGQATSAQLHHYRLMQGQPEDDDYLPPAGLSRQAAVKRLSALAYLDEATFVLAEDQLAQTASGRGQRQADVADLLRRARRDVRASHDRLTAQLVELIARYAAVQLSR